MFVVNFLRLLMTLALLNDLSKVFVLDFLSTSKGPKWASLRNVCWMFCQWWIKSMFKVPCFVQSFRFMCCL